MKLCSSQKFDPIHSFSSHLTELNKSRLIDMAQTLRRHHDLDDKKNSTWNDLKNAWRSFNAAKMNNDKKKMTEFANKIRSLQKDIGAKVSDFPELTL